MLRQNATTTRNETKRGFLFEANCGVNLKRYLFWPICSPVTSQRTGWSQREFFDRQSEHCPFWSRHSHTLQAERSRKKGFEVHSTSSSAVRPYGTGGAMPPPPLWQPSAFTHKQTKPQFPAASFCAPRQWASHKPRETNDLLSTQGKVKNGKIRSSMNERWKFEKKQATQANPVPLVSLDKRVLNSTAENWTGYLVKLDKRVLQGFSAFVIFDNLTAAKTKTMLQGETKFISEHTCVFGVISKWLTCWFFQSERR